MMKLTALTTLASVAVAQKPGTQSPSESHPSLTVSECTGAQECTTKSKSIVLDSNWRWTDVGGTNCYDGNKWSSALCPDATTCATNCALEGAAYEATYGIQTASDELKLNFVTHAQYGDNVGSRVYLLDSESKYYMFKLKNREFSVTVDDSNLDCGLNGALYFVAMSEDGDMSATNTAGAKYGTGYCDAQCPHDMKFIQGQANMEEWTPTSANSGSGKYGACCTEMDIWEGNKISNAVTPHPCTKDGIYKCSGTECGDNASGDRQNGVCDKDGCDFAPYRLGATNFYGPGSSFTIDSSRPFQVVTQFITDDGTDAGDLSEIKRFFVQDDNVVTDPSITVNGKTHSSLTDDFCEDQKADFSDTNGFGDRGGMKALGDQLDDGMVLVMSLWDDYDVNMLWLDSTYPTNSTANGAKRGTCSITSGAPADVESQQDDAYVKFSSIKVGTINSTFAGSTPAPAPAPSPSSHVCSSDATKCTAGCDACCNDYIGDCDACVAAECPAANVCSSDKTTCTTCDTCCNDYIGDCNACVTTACGSSTQRWAKAASALLGAL